MNQREDLYNDYSVEKECFYRGEHYLVRDNGAILRYAKNKRKRTKDGVWTFGLANRRTGYMYFGAERVHRIVAYAFLGEPPTIEYVVDHIDTNRRNNRPQNLRWVTRLENVLNNPITRKKIEFYCGSIETFLNNPSIMRQFINQHPNYEWMRTVSKEEASETFQRIQAWLVSKPMVVNDLKQSQTIINHDWEQTYHEAKELFEDSFKFYGTKEMSYKEYPQNELLHEVQNNNQISESLTVNAVQKYWRTPTEFPFCPSEIKDQPLEEYCNAIKIGEVVSKNKYCTHFADDFVLCNDGKTLKIATHAESDIKKYSLITIIFKDGKYIHEGQTFFDEKSTQRELVLARGLDWTGGDTFDDFVN